LYFVPQEVDSYLSAFFYKHFLFEIGYLLVRYLRQYLLGVGIILACQYAWTK
jgi:hypothetical protein